MTKTKIKYWIDVPMIHRIFVERDEVLTNEELLESITDEKWFEYSDDSIWWELRECGRNRSTDEMSFYVNEELREEGETE